MPSKYTLLRRDFERSNELGSELEKEKIMVILVTNAEYFEWELSEELEEKLKNDDYTIQDIIDEYFDEDKATKVSEDYHMYVERVK